MRKVMTFATVLAAAVLVATPAALASDQQGDTTQRNGGEQRCSTGQHNVVNFRPLFVVNGNFDGDFSGGGGHLYAQSCDDVPPDGNVSMAGRLSPSGFCGYISVDGDPTNGEGVDRISFDNGGPQVSLDDSEYDDRWCSTP